MRETLASVEAEQSVLGGLLIDNDAFDVVSGIVDTPAFSLPEHGAIWHALSRQITASKKADVITVYADMRAARYDDSEIEGGLLKYLNALAQSVPSAANSERYASIVRDRYRARLLRKVGGTAWELAEDQSIPIDERIERVSGELMRMLTEDGYREPFTIGRLMVEAIDRIKDRAEGKFDFIPTGFAEIDRQLGGGLAPGDLVVLGGRPGMGKTALAMDWLLKIAESDPVGLLEMEMSKPQLGDRIVANLGRIDLAQVKKPPPQEQELFWHRLCTATEKASTLSLFIDDQSGLGLTQVRAKARAMKRKHGIRVLVIDYLQLMNGRDPRMPRTYQLEEISRGLKHLAKELEIPIVALAQVNRESERRVNAYPSMSDLKDCGAIEQDADVVFFVHRPIVSDPDLGIEWRQFAKGIFAKNRQGPTGMVNLSYLGRETRFAGWEGPEPERPGRSHGKGFA